MNYYTIITRFTAKSHFFGRRGKHKMFRCGLDPLLLLQLMAEELAALSLAFSAHSRSLCPHIVSHAYAFSKWPHACGRSSGTMLYRRVKRRTAKSSYYSVPIPYLRGVRRAVEKAIGCALYAAARLNCFQMSSKL